MQTTAPREAGRSAAPATAAEVPPVRGEAPSAVDSVLHALMAVGRLMRQRVEKDGLDPGTFWMLKHLAGEPMRITDLAALARLDTSTVSRHVAQLERTGSVRRRPDPDDRRAQQVELTEHGQQQLDETLARRRALLTNSLESWSTDDLHTFDLLLGRFVADVNTLNTNLEHA